MRPATASLGADCTKGCELGQDKADAVGRGDSDDESLLALCGKAAATPVGPHPTTVHPGADCTKGRLVCSAVSCRSVAKHWRPGQTHALKPFVQQAQRSANRCTPAASGNAAPVADHTQVDKAVGAESPNAAEVNCAGMGSTSCNMEASQECNVEPKTISALDLNGEDALESSVPRYERVWRNRCSNPSLVSAQEIGDLGLCACIKGCELGSCLNAVLGIECCSRRCAFGVDKDRQCNNRQFAGAESGILDDSVEVFYTGPAKGFGLRARRQIYVGQLVAEYLGEVIACERVESYRYAMGLKAGIAIDASCVGGPGRFLNHSCQPNCYAQRWVVGDEFRIGLFAAQTIALGEELTFCYASSARGGFGASDSPEPCRCGARCCSGQIGVLPSTKQQGGTRAGRSLVKKRAQKRHYSEAASALEAHWAAAFQDGPPHWPHANWVCRNLFGCESNTPTTAGSPPTRARPEGSWPTGRHELWLAHTWPGHRELAVARSCGLYLRSALAEGRRAWLEGLSLPVVPPGGAAGELRRMLRQAIAEGLPAQSV